MTSRLIDLIAVTTLEKNGGKMKKIVTNLWTKRFMTLLSEPLQIEQRDISVITTILHFHQ